MMLPPLYSLLIIAVVGLVTFGTRILSFVLFPGNKPTPGYIVYLGKVLPYATIGMLVIYCLKGATPLAYPYALPELIAVVAIVALQLWRRNSLLSIGVGTALYMVLVQAVFV